MWARGLAWIRHLASDFAEEETRKSRVRIPPGPPPKGMGPLTARIKQNNIKNLFWGIIEEI
jgi:hypothetical protein